jgi:hypothetical protein
MPFKLFDYVNPQGENEFKEWTQSLQKPQRAKLNEKLDKLALYGDALYPELLTGSPVAGISKLRIRGNVQLRPLLCNGPVDIKTEYTLLKGAKEVGDKWVPTDAPKTANANKKLVIQEPAYRRMDHERIL